MTQDIRALNETVRNESLFTEELLGELGKVIVGQRYLMERLLVGLFADGHLLLEGVPGLAKTLAVHTLASSVEAKFQRVQFTPDLLPADLVGTLVFNPRTGDFTPRKGPIFTNLLLADEINRAPAKVQSALLEAMQERQVTIGDTTYPLEDPFLVLATQNPIEQEGTYSLPEAQVDRFMLKVVVSYPSEAEEKQIMHLMARTSAPDPLKPIIQPEKILEMRQLVDQVHVDDQISDYIIRLVFATREPARLAPVLVGKIRFGGSPRATINLTLAAKAAAFLGGRGYVTPQDVKSIAPDVLRHRIITTFEAEADEVTSELIVKQLLETIAVP